MKLKKHLQRLLLLAGILLLTFYGAAKLHEVILSRSAMKSFETTREAKLNERRKETHGVQPVASAPDFVSWSEQRIKHYEESLGSNLAAPLAILRIARIHVEAPVLEGTDDLTLNRGLGHIAGTALFGKIGNVGIAGHRDGFFRGLKDIKVGDRIEVEEPGKVETYVVDQLEIADPRNVTVLRSRDRPELTLVTCYPFYYIGPAPRRFIVHAALVDSESPIAATYQSR
ncbi:MAG TPA: class D sortase [Terriglobales bacterium]|nr:class D sortase [Terriglobales bacterium]